MLRLKFKAFHPIKDIELSERYLAGHKKVLEDYGITNITSNNRVWLDMECVYAIVAENEEGELVGGIRVQMADGVHPLPVEKAIGHMDARIHDVVNKYADHGVGELCALWNAKSVAGYGISVLLTMAGISITNQVGCSTLMGICGDYTLEMFKNVGFVVDKTLGIDGEFYYPKEDFIARVLGILNSKTLDTARPDYKERMINLRDNPNQHFAETGPKGLVEIDYNLLIAN
ncbi:MAG: hypothetical protein K0Q79_2406 [Flavipsychrobacter sp.]|jgi:hypothetical protein|nr:hypothetical protein [Flavipsychrobacter sp.]